MERRSPTRRDWELFSICPLNTPNRYTNDNRMRSSPFSHELAGATGIRLTPFFWTFHFRVRPFHPPLRGGMGWGAVIHGFPLVTRGYPHLPLRGREEILLDVGRSMFDVRCSMFDVRPHFCALCAFLRPRLMHPFQGRNFSRSVTQGSPAGCGPTAGLIEDCPFGALAVEI
jgi:hypothetical protein